MIKRDLTLTWASPCKTGTWWSWRLDSRGQSVKKEIFITRPSLNTHLHKGSTKCTVSYFEKLNRPCGRETILVSKRALRTRGPINSKFGNRTKVSPRQCFLFLLRKWMYTELFAWPKHLAIRKLLDGVRLRKRLIGCYSQFKEGSETNYDLVLKPFQLMFHWKQ